MKKIGLILLLTAIICSSLTANAFNFKFWNKKQNNIIKENILNNSDIEILPTTNTISNAKNQVWVGTFQLVWNDLINELLKHPVKFIKYDSLMADNLNKQEFTVNELSDSAYYKKTALASHKVKKEIEIGIKEKFNETSDILNSFDWTPAQDKYILYAMLKKDFKYLEPFDKMQDDFFRGSQGNVKYFGINSKSNFKLRNTVSVNFYNNDEDFSVSLKSKQGDIIHLYRTNDEKTLAEYYTDFQAKTASFKGDKYLTKEDYFKAPNIDFKTDRQFDELCNKPIKNSRILISQAIETVQFKMDEVGVKLKSEAGMMTMCTSLPPQMITPRYFYFNGKYIIFIQENNKKPYFMMKIADVKKLQQ